MTCEGERISMKRRRPRWKPITCVLATVLACWTTPTVPFVLVDASFFKGETRQAEEPRAMTNLFDLEDDDELRQHIGYRDDDFFHNDDDTDAPTDTTRPSPSPSMVPSASPSQGPTPFPTPFPTPPPTRLPTPEPSPPPTPFPTPPPTQFPTPPPTPVPTSAPTATPTAAPTAVPAPPPPTQSPTALETPPPSPSPTVMASTGIPVETTASPTTISTAEPTKPMTLGGPSPRPSNAPSIFGATLEPTTLTLGGPTPKPTNAATAPTLPPQKPVPVKVELTPFDVTLTVSQQDETSREEFAESVDNVLTDYLTESLTEKLGDDVDTVQVDLTVTPQRRRRTLRWSKRSLQQEEEITFEVTGNVFVTSNGNVDDEALTQSVESAVESSVNDFDEDEFLDFVQTHPEGSGNLNTVTGASAETQNDGGGDSSPSIVSIVFGSVLVLLAVAMTTMYGYVFWKKHKKRAARRKQQKPVAQPRSTPRAATKERKSPRRFSFMSRSPKNAVVPTTTQLEDFSEDEFGDTIEDSSSDEDAFAKELKWAASLDKRVWEEYEMRQEQMAQEGRTVGKEPTEPYAEQRMIHGPNDGDISYYDAPSPAREGKIEMFQPIQEETRATVYASPMQRNSAARGSVRGLGFSSFPYGDENPEPRNQEEGIEWTPDGIATDSSAGYDGTQNNDEGGSDLTPYNEGWSETNSGSDLAIRELLAAATTKAVPNDDSNTRTVPNDDSNTRTVPNDDSNTRKPADRSASFSEPFEEALGPQVLAVGEDRDGAQSLPDSSTVSSSSKSSGAAIYRASPTTTATTTGAVRASPISDAPIPAGGKDGSFVLVPPKEEESNDGESLLTSEIVREVQNLSRFVKRYEKRRERQSRKRKDKEQAAASIGADVRAAPNLGYDSLSDSSANKSMGAVMGGEVFSDESDDSTDGASTSEEESSLFSSESDDATPEASEISDESRLGISPFKVQKLLSLSAAPPVQKPDPKPEPEPEPVEPETLETKPTPPLPERKSYYSYLMNSARFRRATGRGDKWRSGDASPEETDIEGMNTTLSSLRSNDAILDNTDSEVILGSEVTESGVHDPFSVRSEKVKSAYFAARSEILEDDANALPGQGDKHVDNLGSTVAVSQNVASLSESGIETVKIEEPKSIPAPRIAPRNKNKGFNKIINLFESKPKDAIFPPNESWQYNY